MQPKDGGIVSAYTRADRWAGVYVVGWLLLYGFYIYRRSWFTNDDILWLIELQKWPQLTTFVMRPIFEHFFVPLCRFMIWGTHAVAPMSFGLVVVLMTAFQAATMACLWQLLRLVAPPHIARVLVCIYASCLLPFMGIIWWANAMHRLPYILLAVISVWYYLRWMRGESLHCLFISGFSYLLAYGFYEKTVMIPVFMGIFGWLQTRDSARLPYGFRHRWWWPPLCFLLMAVGYVLIYKILEHRAALPRLSMNPHSSIRAEWLYLPVVLAGMAGSFTYIPFMQTQPQIDAATLAGWVVAGTMWIGVTFFALRRAPRTWFYPLVLLLLLLLDFLPVAMSNRPAMLGPFIVLSYRYHMDSVWLICLLLGMWWAKVYETKSIEPRDRTISHGLVLVYGLVSLLALTQATLHSFDLVIFKMSRDYMMQLDTSLQRVPSDAAFAASPVPGYLTLIRCFDDSREVARLYRPNIRFQGAGPGVYQIDINGYIRRLPP